MKDLLYYKQHNKEEYDSTETLTTSTPPSKLIQLKCIECQSNYSNAYKCKNWNCPLYEFKKSKMKRPHTCSEAFLLVRKTPNRCNNFENLYKSLCND